MKGKSLREIDRIHLQDINYVFTDIDDTLTDIAENRGRLSSEVYEQLWRLFRAGLHVVPITGRPAGWCEVIARHWPVDGVLGENGGLFMSLSKSGLLKKFFQDLANRKNNRLKLKKLWDFLRTEKPYLRLSTDQYLRKLDLAIDVCEDVEPRLSESDCAWILEKAKAAGATAKVSSIHINIWFGAFDKATGAQKILTEYFQEDFPSVLDRAIFIGDSPNDEPLFKFFPKSCAVANISNFWTQIHHKPTWVTSARGGAGFCEFANEILKAKKLPQL